MKGSSVTNSDNTWNIPTIDDILSAQKLLDGNIRKTPLQKSETFSNIVGAEVYLKLESLQKTGSFKVRGAMAKINSIPEERSRVGVIAASAGNHAQGVAYAALKKNIPCTIVMPENASPAKIAATKSYGAQVLLRGASYDESWDAAQKIAEDKGLIIIHAFDDSQVICGQGTIGLELLEDLPDLDQVYLPVGGGGLAAGVAIAIKARKPSVKIIGVQSKAFPAMKEALSEDMGNSTRSRYTIADGISVKSPGKLTLEIARRYLDDIVLVEDSAIVKTMFLLMERTKHVIEPAGAASLAYILSNNNNINDKIKDKKIISLLSGGNVDMYLLGQVVAKGLMEMKRMLKIFIILADKPGALKSVVDGIAELNVNIVEVEHDRLSANIPVGTAGVYLSLEMEDKKHAERLVEFLDKKGIQFKVVS